MKASLACIPCIANQVLLVAHKARSNRALTHRILTDTINQLNQLNLNRPPAEIASDCLARGYRLAGVRDPFKADKKVQHQYASRMLKGVQKQLVHARDPLWLALKYAMSGNLIDSLILQGKKPSLSLKRFNQNPIGINHYSVFKRLLNKSRRILYILDNMGEAVFDKLVIEELQERGKKVVAVVRQRPILNDVVREDAKEMGLNKLCAIIDPGVQAIGLPLHLASASFKRLFRQADLVISKGQANFETLEGVKKDSLFLLFVVKCNTVADYLGVKLGGSILMRNKPV